MSGPRRGVEFEKRLLAARIVTLADVIDDELANLVIAKLLFLEHADPLPDVTLHIDSPGGSVTASLSVCDVMHELRPPVSTWCIGAAEGAALLVLSAGARGKRFAHEAARLKFVPVVGGGGASPELRRLEGALVHAFAQATGQSPSRIRRACRDAESFTADEAVRFGLIDAVLRPR